MRSRTLVTSLSAAAALGAGVLVLAGARTSNEVERIDFNVTRTATRMESAGILRREPHPTDARLVRLRLTERGHELKELMTAEVATLTEKALGTLDQADRERFIGYLNEVRANLTTPTV